MAWKTSLVMVVLSFQSIWHSSFNLMKGLLRGQAVSQSGMQASVTPLRIFYFFFFDVMRIAHVDDGCTPGSDTFLPGLLMQREFFRFLGSIFRVLMPF